MKCFDNQYIKACEYCGEIIEVQTQSDNFPEYYTLIFVRCYKCGSLVSFELPVN